ncbi:MAG TPA: type 2 lanthipeptide synthetase LanM family protein [Thermoanaerobaculia bacterium]|nr:type 2 lanthipeptide synthetase LanM family protein [Thermoanaerobaculia bacterium]
MAAPDVSSYSCYALSLRERLASPDHARGPIDLDRGERRLARWRAQAPFDAGDFFEQRLAADGVSRDGLANLLGEVLESGPRHRPRQPDWAVSLEESFADRSAKRPRLTLPARWQSHAGAELWDFVEPIIRDAHARLLGAVEELMRAHPAVPVRPAAISDLLIGTLPQELIDWPLRVLVVELNVARLRGELTGDDPKGRFQQFVTRLRDPEVALGLLREYPVLARQLVECAAGWRVTTLELLERLCADWPLIISTFPGSDSAATLLNIDAGAGDRHRGGRAVAVLRFASGFQLVYKPRSLAIDARFQHLLQMLNEWGALAPFRAVVLLERGVYGWMEYVGAKGCDSTDDVCRFFQRQGGLLALLYLLRATDIHFENIIAAGEHPVLVDLESMLQPGLPEGDSGPVSLLHDSIVQIGLLPVRKWENETSPGLDISGLGGLDGQLSPRPEPYWAEQATDQMHLARESRQVTVDGRHRPTLQGRPLLAVDFADEIVSGFKDVYGRLVNHRDDLLADEGPLSRLAQEEVRVLLRPTSMYGWMLRESFHPHFLRDGLDRDRFFDKLWKHVPASPALQRVIGAEQEALRRGDIPLFTARPASRDLWLDGGVPVSDFFATSALELTRGRLRRLGDRDLRRQEWFIRASIAILNTANPEREASRGAILSSAPDAAVSRSRLVRVAARIGDYLSDWAMHDDGAVRWLGLQQTSQSAYKIALLGNSLYSGQAGVALFLAYLGHTSGESKYTCLARKTCSTLLQDLAQDAAVSSRPGAFEGLGGVVYVLCHLASLWSQASLIDEAFHLVEALPDLIDRDTRLDLLSGSAGCIAALSVLYECSPRPAVLEVMQRCGEHVLQGAIRAPQGIGWVTTGEAAAPMTGFSHGAAGIAAAMFSLSVQTGQRRFRAAALQALRYERSLFSPAHGNWPDVRVENDRFDQVNWCHGAPGIGLSRAIILRHENLPGIDEELDTAVRTTLARGFGRNHSLCHGDLGNMELLLTANALRPALRLGADIDRLTAQIVEDIERHGWRCGLPMGIETPGLMVGVSGIGYGMLRLAAPEQLPSVLTLAPPNLGSAP